MPVSLPGCVSIKPFDDSMVCRLLKQTGKIPHSTIVAPDIAEEEAFYAEVIETGPGRLRAEWNEEAGERKTSFSPMLINVGDIVLFLRYQGERFYANNIMHIILRQDDVLGTLKFDEPVEESRKEFNEYFTYGKFGEMKKEMIEALDNARVIQGA